MKFMKLDWFTFLPSKVLVRSEFNRHTAKNGNAAQLKRISKAIFRMSVAMGLEPLGPVGAMAFRNRHHVMEEEEPKSNALWICATVFLFACAFAVVFLAWKRLHKSLFEVEVAMGGLQVELISAQEQLADHYGFAARLDDRLEGAEELPEAFANRTAIFDEQALENFSSNEEFVDCVCYGLMELGGFIRHQSLNRGQRSHMVAQERPNLVVWNVRNRPDTTDATMDTNVGQEAAEEESPTSDPAIPPGDTTALLENLRRDQNHTLAVERWAQANQIQQASVVLFDLTAGPHPEGLSMQVLTIIRNIFQRLYRHHRNRGLDERTERLQTNVS